MSSMQLLCVPIPFCVFFLDHTGITRHRSHSQVTQRPKSDPAREMPHHFALR